MRSASSLFCSSSGGIEAKDACRVLILGGAKNLRWAMRQRLLCCAVVLIFTFAWAYTMIAGITSAGVFSIKDPLGGIKIYLKKPKCLKCRTITEKDMLVTKHEKATIIVQGYSPYRIQNYKRIFQEYSKMMPEVVDRIIFVWNNVNVEPPAHPKNDNVIIIQAESNHMMNRFILGNEHIRTDNILTIDDDVVITKGLLRCMIYMLNEFPNTIVGLDPRRIEPEIPSYKFRQSKFDHLLYPSLVVGKTFLMKKKYRKEFRDAGEQLLDSVLKNKPCEHCDDLVAHALVTNRSGSGVVWLEKNLWPNVRISLPAPEGVSNKKGWYGQTGKRSQCVGYLRDIFQENFGTKVFLKTPLEQEVRCLAV